MEKKMKRKIYVLMICFGICVMSLPICAQTVNFNITVSDSTRIDPISKRAQKADSEQKYYVTVTQRSGTGTVRAHSERIDGGVLSDSVYITSASAGIKKSASYYTTANSNAYYFLNCYWESGKGEVNMLGRYTP